MNGDTFQMYLNRLKEDSSESFKSGQSSDKDTFYSSFFPKEGTMKFLFIFTALLVVLADAENAEGMRDCSRES